MRVLRDIPGDWGSDTVGKSYHRFHDILSLLVFRSRQITAYNEFTFYCFGLKWYVRMESQIEHNNSKLNIPIIPLRRMIYELFISLVTLISLVNISIYYLAALPEQVEQVMLITDGFYGIVLMIDFFIRLVLNPYKLRYIFLHFGWLDFISGIPGLPFLRVLRLPRLIVTAIYFRHRTPKELAAEARQRLGESTLLIVLLLFLAVITLGSTLIVLVESASPEANIQTGQEAVWWAIVTMATVGYGDFTPITSYGRMIGTIMIFIGVSIFSALTSYIASSVILSGSRNRDEINSLRAEISELKQMVAALGKRDKND
jgi:voltage-gated potassium channel